MTEPRCGAISHNRYAIEVRLIHARSFGAITRASACSVTSGSTRTRRSRLPAERNARRKNHDLTTRIVYRGRRNQYSRRPRERRGADPHADSWRERHAVLDGTWRGGGRDSCAVVGESLVRETKKTMTATPRSMKTSPARRRFWRRDTHPVTRRAHGGGARWARVTPLITVIAATESSLRMTRAILVLRDLTDEHAMTRSLAHRIVSTWSSSGRDESSESQPAPNSPSTTFFATACNHASWIGRDTSRYRSGPRDRAPSRWSPRSQFGDHPRPPQVRPPGTGPVVADPLRGIERYRWRRGGPAGDQVRHRRPGDVGWGGGAYLLASRRRRRVRSSMVGGPSACGTARSASHTTAAIAVCATEAQRHRRLPRNRPTPADHL